MRALFAAAMLALSACSNSTAYYRAHAAERESKLDDCVDETSADCNNVRQAAFEARGIHAKNGVPIYR